MKKILSMVCLMAVLACCLFAFASCGGPNSDPDKALAGLKDAGLKLATKDDSYTPGMLKLAGINGVKCVVSAVGEIEDEKAYISIMYFESSDAANDAWEKAEAELEKSANSQKDAEIVIKKSGSIIYAGTENAIKAAK